MTSELPDAFRDDSSDEDDNMEVKATEGLVAYVLFLRNYEIIC